MDKRVTKMKVIQLGVITIEVSLCFIILVFTTFFIFEICHQIFITTLTDHALRETVRETKQQILKPVRNGERYNGQEFFHDNLNKVFINENSLWYFMIDKNNYDIQVSYFDSYPDLIRYYQSQNADSPLAEVTLTYQYQPMLLLSERASFPIVRTVVVNLAAGRRDKG